MGLSSEANRTARTGPEDQAEQILVVDDDPATLAMLTDVLRAEGYTPVATTDPREALALLATERFDLVITDVILPHLDGLQLLEKTKERSPDAAVLLISGFGSEDVVREGAKRGAAGFLAKPFDLPAFTSMVREILNRRPPA